jgi:NAD(P)H dehydrogenase (quinone)
MYFGMSVSSRYLEGAIWRRPSPPRRWPASADLEVLVNISQMTVSQMSLTELTDGRPQQRQHRLGEQVLNWSGLRVVHVRPTVWRPRS